MQKVFVQYSLRPEVTPEEFAAWSREVDQAITTRQQGCIRFEVYLMEGTEDGGKPTFQVMEDIEIEDWSIWKKTLEGAGMAPVMADFPKYVDVSTVQLTYGSRVR